MKEFRKFKTKDVSYLFQAPNGVPGDITRTDESNVEPAQLLAIASVYPQSFGLAMVYGVGGIQAWGTSNVAGDFAGSLVREVPAIGGYPSDGFTPNIPNPMVPNGLLVRGYMSVLCQYGTPARGGIVYVNIQATGSRVVGGFEATSQPSFNVALTTQQATWASDGVDAFLNAELRIER
jgi:hypothetical protein